MNLQKMHLRKQFQQAEKRIRSFIISSESAGCDYNYALEQFNQGISLSQNSGTSMEDAESFSEVLQEMLFNQIVCYEKLGDWENAKTKIAEYIQVYPDDADARREAKFLETR